VLGKHRNPRLVHSASLTAIVLSTAIVVLLSAPIRAEDGALEPADQPELVTNRSNVATAEEMRRKIVTHRARVGCTEQ
jgi:hypothetical protein